MFALINHSSWSEFLTKERLELLKQIETQVGENYNPTKDRVLRVLRMNIDDVKVIWLGQDVYPAKGVATGRSFEVGNIHNWDEKFKQVSLKNIIRLIHKSYNQIEDYDKILSYNQIKEEINNSTFPIVQYKKWFDSLEKQGVMFLNSSLTCEVGRANSHQEIWQVFTDALITYLSEKNKNAIWFLWGKEAINKKHLIKSMNYYESRHPMMCSKKYDDDFLKNTCFSDTFNLINWLGE